MAPVETTGCALIFLSYVVLSSSDGPFWPEQNRCVFPITADDCRKSAITTIEETSSDPCRVMLSYRTCLLESAVCRSDTVQTLAKDVQQELSLPCNGSGPSTTSSCAYLTLFSLLLFIFSSYR